MQTIQQVATLTNLTKEDIELIVGQKPLFSEDDVHTVREVAKVMEQHKLPSIEETINLIKGQEVSPSDRSSSQTAEALLSKTVEAILPAYVANLVRGYQAVDANCDQLTSELATLLHHRLSMMQTETLEKLTQLTKTQRPVVSSTEELRKALWRDTFRKFLPPLPATTNRIRPVPPATNRVQNKSN